MSKSEKEKPFRKQVRRESAFIPKDLQHPAAAFVIFVCLIVFFYPIIFENKTFLSTDAAFSLSWDTILKESNEQGILPLWNPYIFCGMPGYASLSFTADRINAAYNLCSYISIFGSSLFQYLLLNSPLGYVIFYYFIFGLGMYLFAFSKVHNKAASLIAALGAAFSMYIIIWLMISHITKIETICWVPWIFMLFEKIRSKFDWKYALLMIPLFHFVLFPFHAQMIFYIFMMFGIYLIVLGMRAFLKKENRRTLLLSAGAAAIAMIIALLMNADKFLSVMEYNPYSIRGSAPIVSESGVDSKTDKGGLDYNYATNWSFSPGEMMTFVLPSWYGFGSHKYSGRFASGPTQVNTYWGTQPFVDGPQYMGIIILFFAVIGFIRQRSDPFVQSLAVTIVFSLFIAFGKEFPLIYDLMFNYFPMFNRFRTPSMALVLIQISVPLLAAYGISSFMNRDTKSNSEIEKKLRYTIYGLAGFLLLSIIGRNEFEVIYSAFFPINEVGAKLAQSVKTNRPEVVTEFYNFVVNSVMTDLYAALGLLIFTFSAIVLYLKGFMKSSVLAVLLILLSIGDLWRIDAKPMEPVDRAYRESIITPPEHVKLLQKDTTLFRTLTFVDGQLPLDNMLAFWKIQNIYGYHAVKMRAYQDMADVANIGNPLLWRLMNVKYIISNTINSTTSSDTLQLLYNDSDNNVSLYRISMPRAFFVRRYETASGLDILNKIAELSFDPYDVAYVMEDIKVQVEPPRQGAALEYTRYGLQDFEINVTATGSNLLFLSETYYPAGWKAFIDGSETPIYRLNYLFRGVVVPAGSHKLEMKFEPRSFSIGKKLSLSANIFVLAGLTLAGFNTWRKKRQATGK